MNTKIIPDQNDFVNGKDSIDFSQQGLESIALFVLDYYKDGKYALDEDTKKQTQDHRTQKCMVIKAFKQYHQNGDPKKIFKYMDCLMYALLECSPQKINKAKGETWKYKKEIDKLKLKMEEIKVGKIGTQCGSCNTNIKETAKQMALQEIKNQGTNPEILKQREQQYSILHRKHLELSRNINQLQHENNELNEKVKSQDYEIEVLQNQIKELKKNSQPTKKKKKKKKVVYVTDSESDSE